MVVVQSVFLRRGVGYSYLFFFVENILRAFCHYSPMCGCVTGCVRNVVSKWPIRNRLMFTCLEMGLCVCEQNNILPESPFDSLLRQGV